jgi:cold shock CspA family protein
MLAVIAALETAGLEFLPQNELNGPGVRFRGGPGIRFRNRKQTERQVMPSGTVKMFDFERGFGFLRPATGRDVFFHSSELLLGGIEPSEVNQGDRLEFELGVSRDGRPAATFIRYG